MTDIERLVRSNLKDNLIIITFYNYNYRNLAEVWCQEMEKIGIKNYLIIASEESAYEALKDKGFNLGLRVMTEPNFWTYEITVIKNIFDYGVDVVHSDLDAIWKKDPTPFMDDTSVDLYFSQAKTFPRDVFDKIGFCMCYGFWFMRHNERTQRLFDEWVPHSFKTFDHQMSINRMLMDTKWDKEGIEGIKHNNFTYWKENIVGYNEKYDIKVVLLPMPQVQREYLGPDALIYHLSAEKCEAEKFKVFKKYNIL